MNFLIGFITAIIAGAAMSIQGVFNTALGEKIGLFETNAFVQGTAFVLSVIVAFIWGRGDMSQLAHTNPLYMTGGLFAVLITATVMVAMKNLNPALAVSVILIAQLAVAALIDALGVFGVEKTPFTWNKYVGIAVMIAGVILFKMSFKKG